MMKIKNNKKNKTKMLCNSSSRMFSSNRVNNKSNRKRKIKRKKNDFLIISL
jgi:hypothetical protein